MIKKYHIADLLTLLEFICAGALLYAGFNKLNAGVAFVLFCLGEVCDAFDGICARKWHYPDDGKRRLWRVYAPLIDEVSDIALGLAVLFYITKCVNRGYGIVVTIICLAVGVVCELWVKALYEEGKSRMALNIVLTRRYAYLVGIAVTVLLLLNATPWPTEAKAVIFSFAGIIAIALWIIKKDRRTQDKTPL